MAAASRYAALRAHAVLAVPGVSPALSAAAKPSGARTPGDRSARAPLETNTWATRMPPPPPPPPPPPRPAERVERGGEAEAVHSLALGRVVTVDGFSTFGLPEQAHRTGKVRYESYPYPYPYPYPTLTLTSTPTSTPTPTPTPTPTAIPLPLIRT